MAIMRNIIHEFDALPIVERQDQMGDTLTKHLKVEDFQRLRDSLGVKRIANYDGVLKNSNFHLFTVFMYKLKLVLICVV